MANLYTNVQNKTDTPKQLNDRIFTAIARYLHTYKDTANSKLGRLVAVRYARDLVVHVIEDLNVNIKGDERIILTNAFNRMYELITEAEARPSTIVDFTDSIGFLNLLRIN